MLNNTEKNWENRGWQKMMTILDEEMPAGKSSSDRKGFLWWWLSAAAALLLLLAGLWPAPQKALEVASLPTLQKALPLISNTENHETSTISEKEQPMDESTGLLLTKKQNRQQIPSEIQPIQLVFTDLMAPSDPVLSSKNEEINIENIQEEALPPSIQELPAQQQKLLVWEPSPALPVLDPKPIQTRKLHPGISLGGLVHPGKSVRGWKAGVFGDFSTPGSRWTFRSGLNLYLLQSSRLRSSASHDDALLSAENSPQTPQSDTSSLTEFSQGTSANFITYSQNLYFLELPTTLSWRIRPRLSLELGLGARLLLNQNQPAFSKISAGITMDNSIPEPVQTQLPRWGASARTSLTYWYNPHVAFGLELVKEIPLYQQSWSYDHDFICLEARYRF